ncbi:LOW QUALITY PROTEIN: CWF19-like protein 2, partial [Galemys pyrenaicus]
ETPQPRPLRARALPDAALRARRPVWVCRFSYDCRKLTLRDDVLGATTTMAAASGRFESARSIEERKELTRIARAELLRQAKADFEKEERRKELKRLRGEDTWMLPDVNERIEQFSQGHSVKKKKKKDKHSKKAKKEKKKKSKKQKYEKNNESSDSSSSSEDEWVEAVPSQTPSKEKAWKLTDEKSKKEDCHVFQRDEWMTVDFMSVKTVSSSSLKAEKETIRNIEQEKAKALEQSRLLERELNPYWKDGGTGLPPEDCSESSVTKVVEDGGLSWLRKSYQRMKEQAEKQNRSFEDIVAERYGSMELFQSKLAEAKKTASTKEDSRRERWRKPTNSDQIQSTQESRKPDLVKHNKSSRDKYSTTDIANSISKDKYSDDEKDKKSKSLETWRRESNPRQSQFSSFGNLKSKFLRPSDDEEVSFHSKGRHLEPSSSSSSLLTQDSVHCGFRKPTDNYEENLSSWSQSDGREGDRKHSSRKPLETRCSADGPHVSEDMSEKSQCESIKDDFLKKEHLQDTESPFAGSSPKGESVHVMSVDEKNKLGAKIIKAEMMGNMELAEKLKAQLEKANKFKETVTQISSKKSGVE